MEIKLKIECRSCGGTGVYQGIGERDGAAVVCYTCDGSGCEEFAMTYTPFKQRRIRTDVNRVYLKGYGYCIVPRPITLSNGVFVDFSKEGVSYEEFLNGKEPKHIKQMGCPMLADQAACHKIKGFTDRCDDLNGGFINHIPSCKCKDKLECWKVFETPDQPKEK